MERTGNARCHYGETPFVVAGAAATGRWCSESSTLQTEGYHQPNADAGRAWHALTTRRQFVGSEVVVGIIAWIILGAIAGFITNLLMGGKEGVIATVVLGIVGAVVGGWLMDRVLNVADVTGLNIESIVVAVIGAVIVVAAVRLVTRRRIA